MIKDLTATISDQALDLQTTSVAPTGFEPALPPYEDSSAQFNPLR
jgi:hypothetical protein